MNEPTMDDHPLLQLMWWLAEKMTEKKRRPRKKLFGEKLSEQDWLEIISHARLIKSKPWGRSSTVGGLLDLVILQHRQRKWIESKK